MSGVTTEIAEAIVDANVRELDGKTVTRPALLVSDSQANLVYAVDVDIGQKRVDPNTGEEITAILRNVPIANGDKSLAYADIGAAVRLRRSSSGRWEVSGFSQRLPGTFYRLPILLGEQGDLPVEVTEYPAVDISLEVRALAYDELADFGGYGTVPYGAYGVFRDGELVEVRA